MLRRDPLERPSDEEIAGLFYAPMGESGTGIEEEGPLNGLSRYLKK